MFKDWNEFNVFALEKEYKEYIIIEYISNKFANKINYKPFIYLKQIYYTNSINLSIFFRNWVV
jgi:hypothetical protein